MIPRLGFAYDDLPPVPVRCAILGVLLLTLGRIIRPWVSRPRGGPYPPGPKPKFLIGNALDLPIERAETTYVEWGRKYQSDILFASALGTHVLVLNKQEDADALLEKRSRIYSDRARIPIVDLFDWHCNIAGSPYGDSWRFHRKMLQQLFRPDAVKSYHPVLLSKVHDLLRVLLKSPDEFMSHAKMFSVAIPMSIVYGYNVSSTEDPCIAAAEESLRIGLPLIMPGAALVNIFSVMKYIPSFFPGAGFKRVAAEVRRLTAVMKELPLAFTTKQVLNGTATPSIIGDFLHRKSTIGVSPAEEAAIHNVAYTVYAGAAETSTSAVTTFIYLMATHPDVQRKAQAELDRVIGTHRLPAFDDRRSLPYIEAIYREVLRWRPPLQLAIPHMTTEDDYYKGYFIPKGTLVFPNIWAMTRDETVYRDPYEFNPDRFIDEKGNVNDDDHILAYGFGRRVCAGKHFANSTVWALIASTLATYNISKAKDASGKGIEVDGGYSDFGLVNHKTPFKCSITPRSDEARRLIEVATPERGEEA